MNPAEKILKEYWGYDSFRPLQKEIIDSVFSKADTLALMPTGGGKSLCYQVPAMMTEGICLVISPLIALMKDQVYHLKKRNIAALSIHSGMKFIEVKKTLDNAAYGNFKFLYVSPERLETELFLEYISILKVSLIAVDEAHCISQWGYDFRPPYLRIASLRKHYPNTPVLALTASATLEVQNDICNKLEFKNNYQIFQQSFERPNLSFSVFEVSSKESKLVDIIKNVPGSGIVYCKSRRRTKEIAGLLQMNGIRAEHYHAGLSTEQRNEKQEAWINNQTRIIACTNAFGMGIDKPDVRTVVHYDIPDALENYYQEAGRAGRDGQKAYAVLMYHEAELREAKKQVGQRYPPAETIRMVYGAICNYLQLPSGRGEGLSFDFDIATLVKNFNLDALVVNNVLKILEQEGLIGYSQQFFSPSTIVFTTSRHELEILEKNYPVYIDLIKGLLRSYDGIFDYPAIIHEVSLAKFAGIKTDDLKPMLHELHRMGILEYVEQKETPRITFYHDRVKAEDLVLNMKNITKRRAAYEKRMEAMHTYALNATRCRSQMIGNYFNDMRIQACGVCDNCIRRKKLAFEKDEFENISASIKKIASQPLIDLEALYAAIHHPKKKVYTVLQYLQDENIIRVTRDGFITRS